MPAAATGPPHVLSVSKTQKKKVGRCLRRWIVQRSARCHCVGRHSIWSQLSALIREDRSTGFVDYEPLWRASNGL